MAHGTWHMAHVHPRMYVHVHVLTRDERRKEEASKVKHTNKAKQHSTPKAVTFHVHIHVVCCFALLLLHGDLCQPAVLPSSCAALVAQLVERSV